MVPELSISAIFGERMRNLLNKTVIRCYYLFSDNKFENKDVSTTHSGCTFPTE